MSSGSAHELEPYWKILLLFRSLPEAKNAKTLMEISGYPHYENVCSNILGFYFDPCEEHGLKELVLHAFFRAAGITQLPTIGEAKIRPQYLTDGGKYIDLVIDGETFTIGIENKIYHRLHNDLEDYAATLERIGQNKSIIVKAVLSLHRIEDKDLLKGGFISVTYADLWKEVRQMLGNYLSQAHPKWATYLIDLMQTTTNLAGENMELKQADRFFIDHHETLKKLFDERDDFLKRLAGRLNQMAALMSAPDVLSLLTGRPGQIAKLEESPWVWQGQCVVFNFVFPNKCTVAFDLWLTPAGWELQLFGRRPESARAYLRELARHSPLKEKMMDKVMTENRYNVAEWREIQTDPAIIKEEFFCWLSALIDAANAAAK